MLTFVKSQWRGMLAAFAAMAIVAMAFVGGLASARTDGANRTAMVLHTSYAPGVPTALTLTGTSARVEIGSHACVRISCDQKARYRVGDSSVTALATDNFLPLEAVDKFCVGKAETHIAFIKNSGAADGACAISVLTPLP